MIDRVLSSAETISHQIQTLPTVFRNVESTMNTNIVAPDDISGKKWCPTKMCNSAFSILLFATMHDVVYWIGGHSI